MGVRNKICVQVVTREQLQRLGSVILFVLVCSVVLEQGLDLRVMTSFLIGDQTCCPGCSKHFMGSIREQKGLHY
jgi:hypothetical protein